MSRSSGGVRPVPEQKGRPTSKVTCWVVDTYGEVDPQGRPLPRQRARFDGSVKEARAERQRLVADLIAQSAPEVALLQKRPEKPSKSRDVPLFRNYVRDTYLPHVKTHHPASTWKTKARHFENHIFPALGDLNVEEANTKGALAKLKAYLVEHPRIRKNSFRNLVLLTYSAGLAHAVEGEILTQKLKIKLFPEDSKRKGVSVGAGYKSGHLRHKRYSQAEVQSLLDAADAMPNPAWWRVLILLGAAAGCRVGEAAARKWSNVDWSKRQISIDSIICSETDVEVQEHTKNHVVADTHPISDELYEALQLLRKAPDSLKSQYILGAAEGRTYLSTRNVQDRYALLTKKAFSAATRNYHRLRHTCASALADSGTNPEVIRQLMRHESLRTTYGYIQPSETSLAQAVNTLNFSRSAV